MTATYRVLMPDALVTSFTDELAATGKLTLPAGLRLAGPLARPPHRDRDELDGAHWVTFTDDGAPAELDGCKVQLILRLEDGLPVIAERRVIT